MSKITPSFIIVMNVRGPFVYIIVFHTWSLFIYVELEYDSKDKLQYSMYFVAGFDRNIIRAMILRQGLKLVGLIPKYLET